MRKYALLAVGLICALAMGATTTIHDTIRQLDVDCTQRNGGAYHELEVDVESLGYTTDDYAITIHCTPWNIVLGIPAPGTEVEVWDSGSFDGLSPFNNSKLHYWYTDNHADGEHPQANYFYEIKVKLWKWDPNATPQAKWVKVDEQTDYAYP